MGMVQHDTIDQGKPYFRVGSESGVAINVEQVQKHYRKNYINIEGVEVWVPDIHVE